MGIIYDNGIDDGDYDDPEDDEDDGDDDVDDNERFQEDCRANRVWEAWEAAAQINQALRK